MCNRRPEIDHAKAKQAAHEAARLLRDHLDPADFARFVALVEAATYQLRPVLSALAREASRV